MHYFHFLTRNHYLYISFLWICSFLYLASTSSLYMGEHASELSNLTYLASQQSAYISLEPFIDFLLLIHMIASSYQALSNLHPHSLFSSFSNPKFLQTLNNSTRQFITSSARFSRHSLDLIVLLKQLFVPRYFTKVEMLRQDSKGLVRELFYNAQLEINRGLLFYGGGSVWLEAGKPIATFDQGTKTLHMPSEGILLGRIAFEHTDKYLTRYNYVALTGATRLYNIIPPEQLIYDLRQQLVSKFRITSYHLFQTEHFVYLNKIYGASRWISTHDVSCGLAVQPVLRRIFCRIALKIKQAVCQDFLLIMSDDKRVSIPRYIYESKNSTNGMVTRWSKFLLQSEQLMNKELDQLSQVLPERPFLLSVCKEYWIDSKVRIRFRYYEPKPFDLLIPGVSVGITTTIDSKPISSTVPWLKHPQMSHNGSDVIMVLWKSSSYSSLINQTDVMYRNKQTSRIFNTIALTCNLGSNLLNMNLEKLLRHDALLQLTDTVMHKENELSAHYYQEAESVYNMISVIQDFQEEYKQLIKRKEKRRLSHRPKDESI